MIIEVGSGNLCDEELAPIGVGSGIRHGKDAGFIVTQLGMEFISELITGTAVSHTEGAAPLNHEAGYDAVEYEAIVEGTFNPLTGGWVFPGFGALGEANEILTGFGGFIREEAGDDAPHGRIKNGVCAGGQLRQFFRHGKLLCGRFAFLCRRAGGNEQGAQKN
jgi:hypothetical protein